MQRIIRYVDMVEENVVREDLQWRKAVPRNLGIAVVWTLKAGSGDRTTLSEKLRGAATPDAQNDVLKALAAWQVAQPDSGQRPPKQKFEFHVGATKRCQPPLEG